MFKNLTETDIADAIDDLIPCFGVKEEEPYKSLIVLVRQKKIQECVQQIASLLRLPIQIKLTYVPKNYKPGNTDGPEKFNKFDSDSLVETDSKGRGVGAIIAQVIMPPDMPIFGSPRLDGYLIEVRVSEGCHKHAETFITLIAHELSHVLLQVLVHPQKDSELHVDLIPVLMGFHDIIQEGRKDIYSTTVGDCTTTHTTTYGYLTDHQFYFASKKIRGIVEKHKKDKLFLITKATYLRSKLDIAIRQLRQFRDYLNYVDTHSVKRMRPKDAAKVVQFHALDYTREWEDCTMRVKSMVDGIDKHVPSLNQYTSTVIEKIKDYLKTTEQASERLEKLLKIASKDLKVLRRYVSLIYRIRNKLSRQRQSLN